MADSVLAGGGQRKTERQVSKKLYIGELLAGQLQQGPGVEPNTFTTARGNANRVNIIGVVIERQELPVSALTIDDGTGQVAVRSFDVKLPHTIGTVVQVIGRPRMYQGQLYVACEAAAKVDPAWAEFRKKELGAAQEARIREEETVLPAQEQNKAERIISVIKQLDAGDGAPIEQVILVSKLPEAEAIIEQLLLHGDIFELRPGKVKVL